MAIDVRQRDLIRHLWREGRLSRWELHERSGMTPNGVGAKVSALLKQGIVRECQAEPSNGGRPRVPLEIDPTTRHVTGIEISAGQVQAGRLNLRGQMLGVPQSRQALSPNEIVSAAEQLLRSLINDSTLAVGVSATGFVDSAEQSILFSSAVAGHPPLRLSSLRAIAEQRPIILENDMHALGARWLLTHQADDSEDVLLVYLADGRLGAAMLIGGRPNRGCLIGGNELGHSRFFVETERCYCGRVGCLERICSSAFLQQHNGREGSMQQRIAQFDPQDAALTSIIEYLSTAIANAANFVRPNRLVLVSEWTRHAQFSDTLIRTIRSELLQELAQRVRIEVWDQPDAVSAETAGWLALASLYRQGWVE